VDKRLARRTFRDLAAFFIVAILLPIGARGSTNNDAHLTIVIREVNLLATNMAPRRASWSENVPEGTVVRTGLDSRAELAFTDQTVARLGASTVFSFKDGTRNLDLGEGAILFQVPARVKGATAHAGAVAAAISGTTGVLEYHPKFFKFLVLEGTGRLYRPRHLGDSVLVHAGQMVFGRPDGALSDPVDFDIGHFLKTCGLISDFPRLRSEGLLAEASQKQQREKSRKILIDTNLVILGGGTVVLDTDPGKPGSVDEVAPNSVSAEPTPTSNSTPARTRAEQRR
jgi:hypothetical protein